MARSEARDLEPVAAPLVPADVDPERLLAAAIDKGVPIETMERLLALREKLRAEQARAAFFDALSAFQGACPVIPKTKTAKIQSSTGGSYTYSYAPLEVIVARVSPILRAHGLSTTFDTRHEDAALVVVCTVHHVAGHAESSTFQVPIDKAARMNDAQKVASASTYARRYAFCNALGIMTGDDDDDGHSGGTPEGQPTGGGPAEFGTPRRASASKPAQDAKPPTGPVQGTLPGGKPEDAISDPRVKRVYALIKEALKANGMEASEANVQTVEAELDRIILASRNRAKWQWTGWKDYDQLCDGIEPTVGRLFGGGDATE